MNALTQWLDQNDIFTTATLLHYWDGFQGTVQLVVLSVIAGLAIALPLAILRASDKRWLSWPVWVFTYIFRGTPLLIQLYLIYYGVVFIEGIQESLFWPIAKEALYPCLLAFTLNTAAYTTEILRGGIESVSKGEIEAGKAYGLNGAQLYKRIILPSAFRRIIPAYSNEVIFMLHASAIASVVTVVDLTGAARDIYAKFYSPFPPFLFVALLYLLITFALVWVFKKVEQRYTAYL